MTSLDRRVSGLIAVGAAVAANCRPCLEAAVSMARESGAEVKETVEAIEVGKSVRTCAASEMDRFASCLNVAVPHPQSGASGGCGCEPEA